MQENHLLHAHLLAVMPDEPTPSLRALRANALTIDGVFQQPLNSIEVTGTPTLLMTDDHGQVKRTWVGQLTPRDEKEVIAAAEQ